MQNPGLADILLKCTENKYIIESTTDQFWGTGILLARDDCLDNRKWISPGLLGEILEEICAELITKDIPANEQMSIYSSPPVDNSMDMTCLDARGASMSTNQHGLHVETNPSFLHKNLNSH